MKYALTTTENSKKKKKKGGRDSTPEKSNALYGPRIGSTNKLSCLGHAAMGKRFGCRKNFLTKPYTKAPAASTLTGLA